MNSPKHSINDEISLAELITKLRDFAQVVWADRRTVLRVVSFSVATGIFIAFGSEKEFTAKTRLLPYRSGAAAGGGLSGLAGLAGIRLPANSGDQPITVDLYPEIAKTLEFRMAVAETPLRFSSVGKSLTAIEFFRDHRQIPPTELLTDFTIGLPGKLYSRIRPATGVEKSKVTGSDTTLIIPSYDAGYLGLVNMLGGHLTVSLEKDSRVIAVSATMPDPYAAADLVRVTSDRLVERIIEYESRKATEQFEFVNEQYELAKMRFERAQRDLAYFADRNRALGSALSRIEQERLQRENDLSFELYQQFAREREQARIKMNQDMPVFTVLEKVVVPNTKSSPRRELIFFVAVLLGLIGGVGVIAVRRFTTAPV